MKKKNNKLNLNPISKLAKKPKEKPFVPYEKENVVEPLKFITVIVNNGQAPAIQKIFTKYDCAATFVTSANGVKSTLATEKKQIVMGVLKESKIKEFFEELDTRLHISKAAHGLGFSVKLTSIAGVSIYKFLSNTRRVRKAK